MSHTLVHDQLLAGGGSLSRRDFVRGIGFVLAGGALLAIGGRRLLNVRLPEVPGETLARSMFTGRVGEMFQVRPEASAAYPLRLVAVSDLAPVARKEAQASAEKERSFSLLFRGPVDRSLDQGTYYFEHGEIGVFSMFIVPVAPDQTANYYEAIFNRL